MTIVAVVALGIAILVYNFLPDYIKKGGPLVALLIMLSIMSVTLTFERLFTLARARGKQPVPVFMRAVRQKIDAMDIEGAADLCAKQRGSLANVLRAGLDRYAVVRNVNLDLKTRMEEVQKAMEEANMLEVPLLERNLIALATIASIATMVGLLGTVIGMIPLLRGPGPHRLGRRREAGARDLRGARQHRRRPLRRDLLDRALQRVRHDDRQLQLHDGRGLRRGRRGPVHERGDEVNACEKDASDRSQDRHDPMVDVAFLLLIFFMSTSQFDPPQKIPITIPDSHSNLKVPESDVMTIGVGKENQILYQIGKKPQEFTDLANLENVVTEQRRRNPRLRVAIKADKVSDYGTMEDIMAVMQKTNTITFSLVTELVTSKKSALAH